MDKYQGCFKGLLNEENLKETVDKNEWKLGIVDFIREEKVWRVVKKT